MIADFFQYPFLVRALIGVLILTILTSALGVFVVLRKISFFGDAIAHSSLAGIALGLLFGIHPTIGAIGFSLLVALGITYTNRKKIVSVDTTIGIFFAAAVAIGVLLIGELKNIRVDILGFLFGDILALTEEDLWIVSILGALVILSIIAFIKPLIQIAFQEDLAQVSGIKVPIFEYMFMLILALVIALGIKVAGVILIAPLLIIPAASAKNIAHNFKSMLFYSIIFGLISGIVGLFVSYGLDLATGPTIILTSSLIFILTLAARPLIK